MIRVQKYKKDFEVWIEFQGYNICIDLQHKGKTQEDITIFNNEMEDVTEEQFLIFDECLSVATTGDNLYKVMGLINARNREISKANK